MTIFIAEAKTHSPFGYQTKRSWKSLLEIASTHGDWVSIHTDYRWDGSWLLLDAARRYTPKPILEKGEHKTDDEVKRALGIGANYVLVVGRIPASELMKYCLLEPRNIKQLTQMVDAGATHIVWNARDLKTGLPKKETFEEACAAYNGWLCQASFIKNTADVKPGANAIIVGEGLETYVDSLKLGRKH